ncbi:MAG: hypothetical protein WBL21_11935 [Salinimicrobium sp.]
MNFKIFYKNGLLSFFLFSLIFMAASCSKDEVPDEDEKTDQNEITTLETNLILDESGQFLNYIIPQTKYDLFLAGRGDYALVTNKVYEYFKDDFDFIFIFADEDERPDGQPYGTNRSVKLDIDGLGGLLYDDTSTYGSAGRLKSILYLPLIRYVQNGPFLHEISHHWANKDFVPSTVNHHWGYSSAGGQLGGFDELVDLGNGSYLGKLKGEDGFGTVANGGNSVGYSNAEMYLMGLIPASDLEVIQVAENPENAEGVGMFTADKITSYTPAFLIDKHGERSPSFNDSQKEFKAITVIISTSPISDERKEMANSNLKNFAKQGEPSAKWGNLYNFWMATAGVGSFDVSIKNENLK